MISFTTKGLWGWQLVLLLTMLKTIIYNHDFHHLAIKKTELIKNVITMLKIHENVNISYSMDDKWIFNRFVKTIIGCGEVQYIRKIGILFHFASWLGILWLCVYYSWKVMDLDYDYIVEYCSTYYAIARKSLIDMFKVETSICLYISKKNLEWNEILYWNYICWFGYIIQFGV